MSRIGFFAVTAILALMIAASTLFVVDQRQIAVVYALGEIKEVIGEPGLKVKLPPPFQNVVFLDRRIQTLDSTETRPIFTAEKKSLVIDWMVKWRVTDARAPVHVVPCVGARPRNVRQSTRVTTRGASAHINS